MSLFNNWPLYHYFTLKALNDKNKIKMLYFLDKNIFVTEEDIEKEISRDMIKSEKYLIFGSKNIIDLVNKSLKNRQNPQIPPTLSSIVSNDIYNISNDQYIDLYDNDITKFYLCILEDNMYGCLIECQNKKECLDIFLQTLDSQITGVHYSLPSEESTIESKNDMLVTCYKKYGEKYYSFHTKSYPSKHEIPIKNCTIFKSTHYNVSNYSGIVINETDYHILNNSSF